jgi:hypothetical protein
MAGGAVGPAPASAASATSGSVVCAGQPVPAGSEGTGADGTPCSPRPAHAPGGRACTVDISAAVTAPRGRVRCYQTYREAIADASKGRVLDAPLDAATAAVSPGFQAEMDRAAVAADSTVLSTEYKDRDFGGDSLTITDGTGCVKGGSDIKKGLPAGWDNTISSFKTLGHCQVKHFADPNQRGASVGWDVGPHDYIGDSLDNKTSSLQYGYADIPTTVELLEDCGTKTDTCDFHPAGDRTTSYGDSHEVTRAYNCSSKDQVQKLTWSDAQSGSNSVSTEISVTAGFDFLEKFEVSFKATYGHEWAWSRTFTNETDLTVPSGQVGTVSHQTKLQSAGGQYELHYGSKHWGHYIWFVNDFSGTGPIPDEAGVTTWNSRAMTAQEQAQQCDLERSTDPTGGKRVMVMGDSISQGLENDYSWRYFLAQHLAAQRIGVNFVGPYTGTVVIPAEETTNAPPVFTGGYSDHAIFDSNHYAKWGWQANQAKATTYDTVRNYKPDYLLVELGFNDLGWFISDPAGLRRDIGTIVAEARRANPRITILVGNVIQRTPMANRPDLPGLISDYDSSLPALLASLDNAQSPVKLANLAGAYNAAVDTYDGLHPNGNGEVHLAAAFADAFRSVGVGTANLTHASIPPMTLAAPATITATSSAGGIKVSWQHVYGAGGYTFWQRDVTTGSEWAAVPYTIGADSHLVNWLTNGDTYEFKVQTARGDLPPSGFSPVTRAVANTQLADPPGNIVVTAGPGSLDLSWDAPTGANSATVTGYDVLYADGSVPGSFLQKMHVTDRSAHIVGLVSGHTYQLAVCSTNAVGQGPPAGAPATTVG